MEFVLRLLGVEEILYIVLGLKEYSDVRFFCCEKK